MHFPKRTLTKLGSETPFLLGFPLVFDTNNLPNAVRSKTSDGQDNFRLNAHNRWREQSSR
jgi:hypothetical protein